MINITTITTLCLLINLRYLEYFITLQHFLLQRIYNQQFRLRIYEIKS